MSRKKSEPALYAHGKMTELKTERINPVDTSVMFRANSEDEVFVSPIDQFIQNTNAINRIYLPIIYADENEAIKAAEKRDLEKIAAMSATEVEDEVEAADVEAEVPQIDDAEAILAGPLTPTPIRVRPELSALVVLGYMSAVESYFRAVLRHLILIDDHVHALVAPMSVSFGAARSHKSEQLPEALTEHVSFASDVKVTEILRTMLGIKGNLPSDVDAGLRNFQKICEIRHCCVHRFGKLGSKTAIALGLEDHREFLETPFAPTASDLQNIGLSLLTFVNTINNFIFKCIIERIPDPGPQTDLQYRWSWNGTWESDGEKFEGYYRVFSSSLAKPPSKSMQDMYSSLKDFVADRRPRRSTKVKERPVAAGKDSPAEDLQT